MTTDEVLAVVTRTARKLPADVVRLLDEQFLRVAVCESESDPDLEGVPFELGFRGLYVGTQLSDEDDEGDEASEPEGTIYLCASNLADHDDAEQVFLHELGHALGLSEVEVEALGLE